MSSGIITDSKSVAHVRYFTTVSTYGRCVSEASLFSEYAYLLYFERCFTHSNNISTQLLGLFVSCDVSFSLWLSFPLVPGHLCCPEAPLYVRFYVFACVYVSFSPPLTFFMYPTSFPPSLVSFRCFFSRFCALPRSFAALIHLLVQSCGFSVHRLCLCLVSC